jgi:AcrR family transcriptional regulator
MARKLGSHSEITGPRITSAATTLIARHGFAAVTMRQIAAEVGVQAGALYLYTPDKQTLLFDLMRAHMEELLDAAAAQDFSGAPEAALEAFTRFHIAFHLDRAEPVFVAYMELRSLTPENFEALERLRKRYEETLTAILRRGAADGVFDVPDPAVTTRALIAMLTGLTTWFRDGGRLTRDEITDLYWPMVRGAVRPG